MRHPRVVLFISIGAMVFILALSGIAQRGGARNPDAEWPMFNRDLSGTRFSPLTQINTSNVSKLTQAWSYKLRPHDGKPLTGQSPSESFKRSRRSSSTASCICPRAIASSRSNPKPARKSGRYELKEGLASFRGVSYWPGDKNNPPRIFFTTPRKMVAINALTGEPRPGSATTARSKSKIPYNGAPTIYKNVILMGSNFYGPGERHIGLSWTRARANPATCTPTTRARKRSCGSFTRFRAQANRNETWGFDSWKNRTGNNVWAFALTVDEERGIVYMPVSGPGMNYYGGDRPGNNLFGNSTVALDTQTGKIKWHFQNIHHEMWDYNLPPAPGLFEVRKDGKTIPALAQTARSGWMFILDRETGKPIFGVEERPWPKATCRASGIRRRSRFPEKPGRSRASEHDGRTISSPLKTRRPHTLRRAANLWDKAKFRNDGPVHAVEVQGRTAIRRR